MLDISFLIYRSKKQLNKAISQQLAITAFK